MRTPDAAMRTSLSHVYYPWQASYVATSIAGGASISRQCYSRCPEHQVFQDRQLPCPKHVGATATIFVAAQPQEPLPRGLRTAVATTTSRPPSSRTEVSAPEGARQIQQGPPSQPKELPRLPRLEG
jgi:hypothetical protein